MRGYIIILANPKDFLTIKALAGAKLYLDGWSARRDKEK
jgi:hypothetical protein